MSERFDLTGPLPTGVTVIEASAGTGKTHAIAGLTARYVADGVPLEQILVVSFTRMASGELRERVRERLVTAERVLAGSAEPAEDDEVARVLLDGTDAEVGIRRERVARALADFDKATISTTHGFCLDALAGLGFTSDVPRDRRPVEETEDLQEQVVDDLYVRAFHAREPVFDRKHAGVVASAAMREQGVRVVPTIDPGDQRDTMLRARLARAAREEFRRRTRRALLMTFDDQVLELDAALTGAKAETVAARLRARYRVALVDEFQDTDVAQWNIMRRAFAHESTTLVLIGDPKQAIYAFRGADVHSYLDAARTADKRHLGLNWRSDQRLLDAYDALFGDAPLGHDEITYQRVRAVHERTRLHGAPVDAALRIRVVERDDPSVGTNRDGTATKGRAKTRIAQDVAQQIAELLASGATIDEPDGPRRLVAGDIAILLRFNWEARELRDELDRLGIVSVFNGSESVFASPAARDWLTLLESLERPSDRRRARAAALTPFLGWTGGQVAEAGEPELDTLQERLHEWARVLRDAGVAALLASISAETGLPRRVLARAAGERDLTDLRHVGELLHGAATRDGLGVTAIAGWLRRRMQQQRPEGDEASRRLETDAQAVQLLTVHKSKGLEFPVVLCPSLWDGRLSGQETPVTFHDPEAGGERTLDVAMEGDEWDAHCALAIDERRGEDLRLAYVALTRARVLAYVWWAGVKESDRSSLGRLLFGERFGRVPADAEALARFEEIASRSGGAASVERVVLGRPLAAASELPAIPELAAARFDRDIDRLWRRTSYSDITAGAHDSRVASEPEGRVVDDEPDEEREPAVVPADEDAVPLAAMPGGTRIGTAVHDVLEAVDFTSTALRDDLVDALCAHRVDVGDVDVVAAGLAAAVATPLGPLLGDVALADVERADRVDEMPFELPLCGGDAASGAVVTPGAIAAAIRRHVPADDPLHRYATRLAEADLRAALRGYLTGSLDLVVRVGGRYAIADYKTNRLGDWGRPLVAADHRPEELEAAMAGSHYLLQGLLYAVALHRHLRWRVRDYEADRHLAGVFYLFVRGMLGPDAPRAADGTPYGVFAWRPPGALLDDLSDLLDRGTT